MYDLESMFLSPKEKQETLLAGISEKHWILACKPT